MSLTTVNTVNGKEYKASVLGGGLKVTTQPFGGWVGVDYCNRLRNVNAMSVTTMNTTAVKLSSIISERSPVAVARQQMFADEQISVETITRK